ncbi:tannase/feruloyl esterase family alpha/beta hydrolase [Cupriavidus taiwanensis]|uniref:Feruloyl esterase n=1 Tax=Cupriavidus taiwanensis TaxID=164546 RepID=A0A375JBG6_9BURK|nr:tannase/feruloyl esterase family alpha/beta hydrolase [Cupriavidus taiwanensis]SPS02102.1 feruloyl esterase [Cupriavidus taiwanensis]
MNHTRDKVWRGVGALTVLSTLAISLAGCGGEESAPSVGAPGPTTAQKSPTELCGELKGIAIPAGNIGLASTGATITTATLVAASDSGNTSGEFCKVLGGIHPVDSSAPDIQFEVDLPTAWNGKSLHFGGGGLDGVIPDTTGFATSGFSPYGEPRGVLAPLARGYVTYGSDAGHQAANDFVGTFASNDEALANYAGNHIKKTHDVATFLMKARYGQSASQSYFIGGSGGGRMGLVAAQKYASDYDGIVATYPASGLLGLSFQMGRISQASLSPGGFINAAKGKVLRDAVMSQCDSLDGVADGVISNPGACGFDATTLRCPGGADTGDTCLSDAQLNTVATIATPLTTTFDFANGIRTIPGFKVLAGTDFWGPLYPPLGSSAADAVADPATADVQKVSFFYAFPNALVKYAIARAPSLDILTFGFTNPGALTARTQAVSQLMDGTSVNFDALKNKGGKLILQHGQADQFIPAQMSVDLYNRLLAAYGQSELSSFLKFYLFPGAAHGFGGQFEGGYDSLTALDNWVTKGVEPHDLIVTDVTPPTAGRKRPVCEYPAWPKYVGGDPNSATSYVCTT